MTSYFSQPECATESIFQLMTMCQADDPEMRPSFSHISHHWKQIASGQNNPEYMNGLNEEVQPLPEPQRRSTFINQSYFSSGPLSPTESLIPTKGNDGYLLPSPTHKIDISYLQLVKSDEMY